MLFVLLSISGMYRQMTLDYNHNLLVAAEKNQQLIDREHGKKASS